MAHNLFFKLYQKLAAARHSSDEGRQALEELSKAFIDSKQEGTTSEEWLNRAESCLYEVAHSEELFVAAISRWLTDDDYFAIAKALLDKAGTAYFNNPAPTVYNLSNIEENLATLTAYRLCTRLVPPALTIGWLLSLAKAFPGSEKTKEAVVDLLNFHVEEFPRTTLRLLSAETSAYKDVEIANQALAVLREREYWIGSLPRLREFSMTPEMRLAFSSLKRNESRAIQRHSERASIFSQIFSMHRFKYAHSTAFEMNVGGKIEETNLEMSHFEVSMELPISELTDPQHGLARRQSFWKGKPE